MFKLNLLLFTLIAFTYLKYDVNTLSCYVCGNSTNNYSCAYGEKKSNCSEIFPIAVLKYCLTATKDEEVYKFCGSEAYSNGSFSIDLTNIYLVYPLTSNNYSELSYDVVACGIDYCNDININSKTTVTATTSTKSTTVDIKSFVTTTTTMATATLTSTSNTTISTTTSTSADFSRTCSGGILRLPSSCGNTTSLFCENFIFWTYSSKTQTLFFKMKSLINNSNLQWLGVGFNKQNQMINSDAIIGYSDDQGVGSINDRYLFGKDPSQVLIDPIQEIFDTKISIVDGWQIFEFSRGVNTDSMYNMQLNESIHLLYAKGFYNLNSNNVTLSQHSLKYITENKISLTSCSVSDCSSFPCLNGATCLDDVVDETFFCLCPPNYSGTFCEESIIPQSTKTPTKDDTLAIAIAVPISIIALITILVIVFIMKRKQIGCFKIKNRNNRNTIDQPGIYLSSIENAPKHYNDYLNPVSPEGKKNIETNMNIEEHENYIIAETENKDYLEPTETKKPIEQKLSKNNKKQRLDNVTGEQHNYYDIRNSEHDYYNEIIN